VIIFSVGIYIGSILSASATEDVSRQVKDISQRIESAQLLSLLEESNEFCPFYVSELGKLDDETERVGYKLTFLEQKQGVVDENLKKKYFILETETYLLSKKINNKCGMNNTLILYFYSHKECEKCREQGEVLLAVKEELADTKKVKIYSFDGELGSEIADALEKKHGIKTYPSIVIDDKVNSGFLSKELIEKMIFSGDLSNRTN